MLNHLLKRFFNDRAKKNLQRQILLESPTLCVSFVPSANSLAKTIAFSFSPMVKPENEKNHESGFIGERLLTHSHVISFQAKQNLWFQDVGYPVFRAIDDFLTTHQLHKHRRIGLGASMGGFGVIQMSSALKLNSVLAFAPQFAIDEAFDRHWEKYAARIRFVRRIDRSSIAPRCQYWIVYDPKTIDLKHAERIRPLIHPSYLRELRLPYAGHKVSLFIKQVGELDSLIETFLSNKPLSTDKLRRKRGQSAQYLSCLAHAATAKKHERTALPLIERSLALAPDFAEAHFHHSVLLGRSKADSELILASARTAYSLEPGQVNYCKHLCRALHKAGLMQEALVKTEQWLRLEPSSADAHRLLSTLHTALGNKDQALIFSSKALQLSPNNATLAFHHSNLLMTAGMLEESLNVIERAIQLDEGYAWYHRHRSIVLGRLGRTTEALTSAQRAAHLAPNEQKIITHLKQTRSKIVRTSP